jgi:cytochrome c553
MLKVLLAVLFLSLSSLQASDEEYTFKAKGEFAKELKALMEKYEKEGKVQIEKIETKHPRETQTIVQAFLNQDVISGDIAYGKKIYEGNCISCHGINASKSSYPNARTLSNLSKNDLIEQLEGYSKDVNFGKSTKAIMYQQVVGMSSYDIVSVASYIYSIQHGAEVFTESTKNAVSHENEPKSSYLQ